MGPHRFVLRYRGEGAAPPADVARVVALPSTVVVDASARMLLVDAGPDADGLRALIDTLADWVLAPEQSYAIPDTRKRVDRPPEGA